MLGSRDAEIFALIANTINMPTYLNLYLLQCLVMDMKAGLNKLNVSDGQDP